jgi:glycerol-3-phosphate O-acyltransferase
MTPCDDPPSREGDRSVHDGMLARSAMHEQYGGLLKLLFERVFGPIQYPEKSAEAIRELGSRGTLVYVARARSVWLGLYFNYALSRLELPLAHFVGGINLLLWQPLDRLWRLWRQRHKPAEGPWRARYGSLPPTQSEALLADLTLRGEPSFLFLQSQRGRRRWLRSPGRPNDYLRALIAAQRVSQRPIFIVPHALVGRWQGGAARGAIARRLLGSSRRESLLGDFNILLTPRLTAIRVADALNLQEFIAESREPDDARLARRLAYVLRRRIGEEERVVAGPELPRFESTRRHVLRDGGVREAVGSVGKKTAKSTSSLERRAGNLLDEIAARYHPNALRFLGGTLGWVFNRIYDGIAVDEAGFDRVLEAARKGPVIFCPAHRSHVDYLVLSYVLWDHGIAPPHIAAGANLSFFPLGSIFRRCGAFFLRRAFGDDALYRAVFRAYVAELVRSGAALEFFIEGGRSRTGKLLLPKYGFLNMVVDAWRGGARDDLQFAPVSIDYERIIEAGSYERELAGGEKRPEDIGALLRTTRVLRSRYGRVHVQFGEPFSLAELARRRGLPQSAAPEHDPAWRAEVGRLGYRILYGVGQVCTVTPTAVVATALLGHRGRGLPQGSLLELAGEIVEYLDTAAARLSETLRSPETRTAAILEAVQKLVDEETVAVDRAGRSDAEPIYRVLEERRILLDYHKNAVMNYFAPAALVARSLVRRGLEPAGYSDLLDDTGFLSRLFKREFIFRVDAKFDTHFDDALGSLAVRGLLDVHEDGTVIVRDQTTIKLLASLLDSFVEAYWMTLQTLPELRRFPLWERELATRALEQVRRAYLEGTISRPEAANRTLIESAIAWLREGEVLVAKGDGKRKRLEVAEAYEGEKLAAFTKRLGSYL